MEEFKTNIANSNDPIMISWYSRCDDDYWAKHFPECLFCIQEYTERLKQREGYKTRTKEEEERQKKFHEEMETLRNLPPKRNSINSHEEEEIRQLLFEKDKEHNLISAARTRIARIDEKLAKLNVTGNVIISTLKYCTFCELNICDNDHRTRHLESHAHKVKAGLITVETYPKTCEPCGYDAKNKSHWDIHCRGKKHLARTTNIETEEVINVE